MEIDPLLEERFERFLGNLLRTGVLLAAGIVLLGGILYLIQHGAEQPDRVVFRGEPADLRSLTGIFTRAQRLNGSGTIMAGLLVLIATPVARVICSIFGFFRERDFLYVALTLVVLGVLLYSLFVGETF